MSKTGGNESGPAWGKESLKQTEESRMRERDRNFHDTPIGSVAEIG